MGKVNLDRYSKKRPKVEESDLQGGNFIVAQIVHFEDIPVDQDGEKKLVPSLRFQEFGDKVLWLNKTQMGYLVERLGDETDRWTGKMVPLVVATVNYGDERFRKVQVAAPEEWDDLLTAAAKVNRKPAAPARGKKR